jgi:hypothetical protein
MIIFFKFFNDKVVMNVTDPFNLKYEKTFQDFFYYFGKSFIFDDFLCYQTFNDQISDVISNVYVFRSKIENIKKLKIVKNNDFFDLTKKKDLKQFVKIKEQLKIFFLKNIQKNNVNLDSVTDFFT